MSTGKLWRELVRERERQARIDRGAAGLPPSPFADVAGTHGEPTLVEGEDSAESSPDLHVEHLSGLCPICNPQDEVLF